MKKLIFCFLTIVGLTFIINNVYAQLPVISYTTPDVYTVGSAITPLAPTSTGGAVPAQNYAGVTNILGTGTLNNPQAIACDNSGNSYVADYGNNIIRKVTSAGVVSVLAGAGGTGAELDGTGAGAKFNGPDGIAYDNAGNLYVADAGGNTIRKIVISSGVVTTYSGTAGTAGSANGARLAATYNGPAGLDVDPTTGNIFICDQGNNTIRMISGGTVSLLAGTVGSAGLSNTAPVKFSAPNDLVCDGAGNVYVADYTNSVVRKVVISTGATSTFAGSGTAGYTNGTGAAAQFNRLGSIAIDGLGNLYVADLSNNRIRMVTTPGAVVTTIAGSGTASELAGVGAAATFNGPGGIDVDNFGNCFIIDFQTGTTGTVREMFTTGYSLPTAPTLPAGLSFTTTPGSFTGTPTAILAATNYTVTAYNTSGNASCVVNIAVGTTVAWTAGSNTQLWATNGNWSSGLAPTANDAVTIGVSAYTNAKEPIITTAVSVNSITFANTGGAHILTVTSPGSLTVGTSFTVNTASTPTITGTGAINISPGATLNVNGTGALNTTMSGAGKLTLKSNATGSASVGQITATSITGSAADSIHVERYMTGGAGYRGYRLLSSPVYVAAAGGNNVAGLQYLSNNIFLTGAAGGGFNKTGNPTIFLFREDQVPNNQTFTTGNFWGISAINNATSYNYFTNGGSTVYNIPVGNGYMVFFRGDRSAATVGAETVSTYTPVTTTLSAYGTLNAGPIVVHNWYTPALTTIGYTTTVVGANNNSVVRGYNLIGNPYASSIDWEQYNTASTTTGIYVKNVGTTVYELNPATNNYDTYQVGGAFTNSGSRTIVSGQAFFVIGNFTGSVLPQLIFNESAKASSPYTQNTGLNLFEADKDAIASLSTAGTDQHLRIQLSRSGTVTDDTYIGFNTKAKAEYVDDEDAPYKPGNGQVGLASMSSDHIALAINFTKLPVTSETIKLTFNASIDSVYTLKMLQIKSIPQLYDIWLKDAYRKDSIDMRHNSSYSFDVVKADTNTYGSNRFSLVIRQNQALALRLLSFAATKAISGAQITWTTENEQNYTNFTVERSTNSGKSFDVLNGFLSTASGNYSYLDKSPLAGVNQYRLKLEDLNGTITYSSIVTLNYDGSGANTAKNTLNIYPNPTTGIVNVTINQTGRTSTSPLSILQTAQIPVLNTGQNGAPSYSLKIISISGAIVRSTTTTQSTWRDNLGGLQPGTYIIQVVNSGDNSLVGKGTFVKL